MPQPDASSTAEVSRALDTVRPRLRGHAGDVEVVSVGDGEVELRFTGACAACPALPFTYVAAIEPALREAPGVRSVVSRQLHASPALLQRLRTSLGLPDGFDTRVP
jgi:Fe-S cluster biogenesis protein NfuA